MRGGERREDEEEEGGGEGGGEEKRKEGVRKGRSPWARLGESGCLLECAWKS